MRVAQEKQQQRGSGTQWEPSNSFRYSPLSCRRYLQRQMMPDILSSSMRASGYFVHSPFLSLSLSHLPMLLDLSLYVCLPLHFFFIGTQAVSNKETTGVSWPGPMERNWNATVVMIHLYNNYFLYIISSVCISLHAFQLIIENSVLLSTTMEPN